MAKCQLLLLVVVGIVVVAPTFAAPTSSEDFSESVGFESEANDKRIDKASATASSSSSSSEKNSHETVTVDRRVSVSGQPIAGRAPLVNQTPRNDIGQTKHALARGRYLPNVSFTFPPYPSDGILIASLNAHFADGDDENVTTTAALNTLLSYAIDGDTSYGERLDLHYHRVPRAGATFLPLSFIELFPISANRRAASSVEVVEYGHPWFWKDALLQGVFLPQPAFLSTARGTDRETLTTGYYPGLVHTFRTTGKSLLLTVARGHVDVDQSGVSTFLTHCIDGNIRQGKDLGLGFSNYGSFFIFSSAVDSEFPLAVTLPQLALVGGGGHEVRFRVFSSAVNFSEVTSQLLVFEHPDVEHVAVSNLWTIDFARADRIVPVLQTFIVTSVDSVLLVTVNGHVSQRTGLGSQSLELTTRLDGKHFPGNSSAPGFFSHNGNTVKQGAFFPVNFLHIFRAPKGSHLVEVVGKVSGGRFALSGFELAVGAVPLNVYKGDLPE